MLPTLFISHGSPTVMIETESPGHLFMKNLVKQIQKPKAILVVSAHWETDRPMVTSSISPETIYDFRGFDEALYKIKYPASGLPELAQKVANLVDGDMDDARGIDHGVWSPLHLMYPNADIPVVQLSLQTNMPASYHFMIGQKLRPLREDDVLIIGSGSATHNLKSLRWFDQNPENWAIEFENWLVKSFQEFDIENLLDAENVAPFFAQNHPTPEHWLPIYVAMGAGDEGELLHRGFEHKNLSMASFRFD